MSDDVAGPLDGVVDRAALMASFHRWGFSDLTSNATRGVLAEYLVGRALGVDLTPDRIEWDAYDLKLRDGTKIEVKSSAYVQTWTAPAREGQVRYSGLLARHIVDADAQTGAYTAVPGVRADVYVFALQTCRDRAVYDALAMAQWEFRVVPGSEVRSWNQRSIGLAQLEAKGYPGMPVNELPAAVTRAAAESGQPGSQGLTTGGPAVLGGLQCTSEPVAGDPGTV